MFGDLRNSCGERLDYAVHGAAGDESLPLVVIGHGVTGNKDRPFVVALADGVAALRFSFSGNGDSEGRFAESTVSKEVEDLGSVFDVLGGRPICYVGHSMGAAVGLLRARSDQRIRWLVSLAGMVHTRAFCEREFGDVTPGQGFMWDEPDCPLSQAFVDDMATVDSVVDRAADIGVPWLLVHGTEDDVVALQDALDLVARAGQPEPRLIQLDGAGHVFSDDACPRMVDTVVDWVQRQTAG